MRFTGRVTDTNGQPLSDLVVTVHPDGVPDVPEAGDTLAVTGPDGRFAGELPEHAPSVIAVRDRGGIRVLDQARIEEDSAPGLLDFTISREDALGWLVTAPEGGVTHVSEGNRITFLVDGEAIFAETARLVHAANRSVALIQLLFQPDLALTYHEDETPKETAPELLADAARRGVMVRLLVNENAVIPDHLDEARKSLEQNDAVPDDRVRVRGLTMTVNVLHAKTLLVDDRVALVLGTPFEPRFWDTRAHRFHDARRGTDQAMHDVGLRVEGPAVSELAATFAEVWNRPEVAGNEDPVEVPAPPSPVGNQVVQRVRTFPPGLADARLAGADPARMPGHVDDGGEMGILQAYMRAFANAERFVYLENQYFTSETIVRIIRRVLERKPDLQVIHLGNEHMDVPGYDQWRVRRLQELAEYDNFAAFSLWSRGEKDGRQVVRQMYLHSKVAIVDDRWAMVGSANLDGISLEGAYEFLRPDKRSVDECLVLPDGVDGHPATGIAADLRRDLWSEHLGLPDAKFRSEPPGGWLALWKDVAEANLRSVRVGHPHHMDGRVLPLNPDLPDAVNSKPALKSPI